MITLFLEKIQEACFRAGAIRQDFVPCLVVALCPWLTAMVMLRQSVDLTTVFLGRLRLPKWLTRA